MINPIITDYAGVPKIELHLHLEGAIPLEAMWALCKKYGGDPAVPDIATLQNRFSYTDFPHFIDTWVWKNQFIREYEDFTFIAERIARDLVIQNIVYAEIFYSPPDFFRHGLATQEITAAIRTGLNLVPEIEVALIADLVRDFGPKRAEMTLHQINEVKAYQVIGIGIGGSEQSHPAEQFAQVYEKARHMGFHTTAHAGEAAGAGSIWGAVNSLQVERIGHGTRAFEDPALLAYLADRQIPLEMCPVSNVRTGIVQNIENHPIRPYFEHGILVTVNTDDPKMFDTSLAGEYGLLEERLGFSPDDIRQLIKNAIKASWLPESKKKFYSAQIGLNVTD